MPDAPHPLAIPTDAEPVAPVFDPVVGEEAFLAKEAALRALKPDDVLVPNCAPAAAAVVALRLVEVWRAPERSALLAQMPAAFMGGASVEELEQLAWALWYVDARFQSFTATSSDAKLDVATADQAAKLRARMLRVLDYHFADHTAMQAELADLRSGHGYQDLATDLTRLAGHYSAHKEKLAADKVFYQPEDEALARSLARQIVSALMQSSKSSEVADLRNRAWTLLASSYDSLRAAGEFIYRQKPRELALFPNLRTAVLAASARGRTAEQPATPVVGGAAPGAGNASPTPPPAPAPAPTPVAPGMPGGNPLGG